MSRLGDVLVEHGPLAQDYLVGPGFAGPLRQLLAADLNALREELIELRDLRILQRMQWDRMAEATALWRAEDPEARALVMPDLGALLQWLMDRAAAPAEPCRAETRSWDHFTAEQVDSYWIRCTLQGQHDEHKDEHTGLTWVDQAAQPAGARPHLAPIGSTLNLLRSDMIHDFKIGDIIHGFCGGSFGRDSYACRRVEAVGPDWIVTRNSLGDGAFSDVELSAGVRLPTRTQAADTSFCDVDCDGPDLDEKAAGSQAAGGEGPVIQGASALIAALDAAVLVELESSCASCGKAIVFKPYFLDGKEPNQPMWFHPPGSVTCSTNSKDRRGADWPRATPASAEKDTDSQPAGGADCG